MWKRGETMNSHPSSRGSAPTAAAVAVAAAAEAAIEEVVVAAVGGTQVGGTQAGAARQQQQQQQQQLKPKLNHSGRSHGPLGAPARGPRITSIGITGITGPAPTVRYRSRSRSSASNYWTYRAVIFLLLSCWTCVSFAAAASIPSLDLDESPRPTATLSPTLILSRIGRPKETELPEPETLLIDTRIPVFVDGYWRMMSDEEHRELRRRGASAKETTAPAATATTTEIVIDPSTVTNSADPVATTTAASPLPSPFDGALAANFSAGQSCPNFINEFLSNATFKACYPISLLLQGSQSFFEAEKNFVTITRVLDAACDANLTMCTDYFNDLASDLIDDSHCGKEYDRQNALVVQAYQGMKTYEVVYRATCLTNSDANSSSYCFANAITNASTASNSYLYYLPFNSTLPTDAVPACGSCTRQTMEIYQAATSNRKADITLTYPSAAKQINTNCGTNFVNTSLAVATGSGAMASLHPPSSPSLLLASFVFMAISHWIL
ncbi:hypothetical protein GGR51DRAFT_191490 [Nemania sp. FL0031]|nr:hypothetical protein GGR51DRAFT_191490 [Nemania sp. FL0031]